MSVILIQFLPFFPWISNCVYWILRFWNDLPSTSVFASHPSDWVSKNRIPWRTKTHTGTALEVQYIRNCVPCFQFGAECLAQNCRFQNHYFFSERICGFEEAKERKNTKYENESLHCIISSFFLSLLSSKFNHFFTSRFLESPGSHSEYFD